MGNPSKAVSEFMEKFGVDSDEIWQVHGKDWIVMHKALERIAFNVGIVFDRPSVVTCDLTNKIACLCVFGKLGDHTEWSFGEASPANNKNAYPMAIAEKRAKDRVILKLLVCSGELYSSVDDIPAPPEKRQNPHVTRPEDIGPSPEYDENGEIIDNVPHAEATRKLRVVDQRPIFEALQKEAFQFGESKKFIAWMNDEGVISRVSDLKKDWQDIFRGICKDHLKELRTQESGDDMRMAG